MSAYESISLMENLVIQKSTQSIILNIQKILSTKGSPTISGNCSV